MTEVPVDLEAWLTAQFDEDEALARSAAESAGTTDGTPGPEWTVHYDAVTAPGGVVATGIEDSLDKAVSAHIARWDPARVLAEIAAKRKRLAMHRPTSSDVDAGEIIYAHCTPTDDHYMGAPWPCDDVLLDAAPYAGRPGWRDEWATA